METNYNILKTELASEREKNRVFPKIVEVRDDLNNKLNKS